MPSLRTVLLLRTFFAVLSVGFLAAWATAGASHLVWGSVGEWVGGIGSILAAGTAVTIAVLDSRRREVDRKDEQAAQARLVTVEARPAVMFGAVIEVTNHSMAPVFALVIECLHSTPDQYRAQFLAGKPREWARLDPGKAVSAVCHLWTPDGRRIVQVEEPTSISAEVSFVDARGLRWRRWGPHPPTGGLPIKDRTPPEALDEMPLAHEQYSEESLPD